MPRQAATIRFDPDEREWIQSYADFHGRTFSDVVRDAILEKIEDEADIRAYNDALTEDIDETVPFEQILEKYGMSPK